MGFPLVPVVVPALNEERNIPHVFEQITPDVHQIVLAAGRSVYGTMAADLRLRPGSKR